MTIAGLDVGTTGCKCSVYAPEGTLLKEAYREYERTAPHALDTETVWQNVKAVLAEAAGSCSGVQAIGVASFGEAAVLLDERNAPLMDSLLYTSPLGGEQCRKLVDRFGADCIAHKTGLNPGALYSLPKLMWIRENRPDLFARCRSIALFEDFIVCRLSGKRQIDYSMASRTMAFDIRTLAWDRELLDFAGIDPGLLPEPVATGTPAGCIRPELADELGIDGTALIVSGCHDQIAAAIGAGAHRTGSAVDGIGSVECVTPVFESVAAPRKLTGNNYAIVPFPGGKFVTYAFTLTGGALLKWFRDRIIREISDDPEIRSRDVYARFDALVADSEPSGLLVLPHFAGAGTPYMDSGSTGAILGLTTDTAIGDLYKALMEGVTYEMRLNLDRLAEAGVQVDELIAAGGGAGSDVWLQIKADILNRPIVSMGAVQSGTLGCAMLAGMACGMFASLREASAVFVRRKRTYQPDPERHARYAELFAKYRALYASVRKIMRGEEDRNV